MRSPPQRGMIFDHPFGVLREGLALEGVDLVANEAGDGHA